MDVAGRRRTRRNAQLKMTLAKAIVPPITKAIMNVCQLTAVSVKDTV